MTELQIVVTEQCNLNCSYCYMNNNRTFLDRETFDTFYQSLPVQDFSITFFGGEPLLNWDMVVYITDTVSNDPRFKSLTITSNGLLLDEEKVAYILANDIKFSWSCDGLYTDKSRAGATLDQYVLQRELIKQVTDMVRVSITSTNVDMIGNYKFFQQYFDMTPEFWLIEEDWTEYDIEHFRRIYSDYISFIITEFREYRIEIPRDIMRNFSTLVEGTRNGFPKRRCFDDTARRCLMPSGDVGFCARKCVTGDFCRTCDEAEIYTECEECPITNFCSKGCWVINDKNGLNKSLCEIYKIILEETIRFNHELVDDGVWIHKHLRRYFDESKRSS